jgi:hypothetical protein
MRWLTSTSTLNFNLKNPAVTHGGVFSCLILCALASLRESPYWERQAAKIAK